MDSSFKKEVFKAYLAKYNEEDRFDNIHIIPDTGILEYDNCIYDVWDDIILTDKYKELKSSIIKELQEIKDDYVPSKYIDYMRIDEDLIDYDVEDLSPQYIIEEFNYNLLDTINIDNNDYYIVEPC